MTMYICTLCHLVCLDALLCHVYLFKLELPFSSPACGNDLISTPPYFIEKDIAAKKNSACTTVTVGEGIR